MKAEGANAGDNEKRDERPLPAGWRWVQVGKVCELVGDSIDPQGVPDEVFAYYSIPAYDDGQTPILEPGARIHSNKLLFPGGAVLFSKLNPRISRVWHVNDRHTLRRICSTEFLPLVPDTKAIDPNYLELLLQEPRLVTGLRAKVAAATKSRERLKPELVMRAWVPLPPLAEQQRIAAILAEQMAAVERARAAAEARLEAAKALPAAYLRTIFDGPEAHKWSRKRLGELLRLRKEVVHPKDDPIGPATFVGLEHVEPNTGRRIGSVQVEMASLTGRKPRFLKGDIVYGYLRPYLNKVWVADFGGLCSVDQYVYSVDQTKTNTDFVAWFMRSPVYLTRAPIGFTPGQLPRIRTEEVASVEINLPSSLEDQSEIATVVAAWMNEIEQGRKAIEDQLAAIHTLPGALMSLAFAADSD